MAWWLGFQVLEKEWLLLELVLGKSDCCSGYELFFFSLFFSIDVASGDAQ